MRYSEQRTILDEIDRTDHYSAMVIHGTIYLYLTEDAASLPKLISIIRSIDDWDALQPSPVRTKQRHYYRKN